MTSPDDIYVSPETVDKEWEVLKEYWPEVTREEAEKYIKLHASFEENEDERLTCAAAACFAVVKYFPSGEEFAKWLRVFCAATGIDSTDIINRIRELKAGRRQN